LRFWISQKAYSSHIIPARRITEINPDSFEFGVLIMGVDAVVVASEAGLFIAAKRGRDVALAVTVDCHRPGLDRAGGSDRALAVGGEDARGQAIGNIVRGEDRVFDGGDFDDRQELEHRRKLLVSQTYL